jgi:glycosyltransferase involved in cell wall biosynthesis
MIQEENIPKNHKNTTRHCMVVHAYYPLGETRVERQALALRDHGTNVDIICLKKPQDPVLETVNGVQVHRLPVRRYRGSGMAVQLLEYLAFFLLAFFQLTRLHFRKRFDVIQVHNLPDFLVFVALIPKLTGAKVILDLHDLMPEFYAERTQQTMSSLTVRIIQWQEKFSCFFADHIITVTDLWRRSLIERGQPPEKVSVVMNVADDRFFHQNMTAEMPNDSAFRLIYHGIMGQRHGLDLALRALDQVRKSIPGVHLTLHGSGEHLDALRRLVDELGLQEHVRISTGFVVTEELAKFIKSADLGIIPYREGVFTGGILPTKLMEYAALGIPAIVARTPAIAKYFDDSMVQFFTPGDAEDLARCIQVLDSDRKRLAELTIGIQKFNQQYNWKKASAGYVACVEQLVAKK